MLTNSSSNCPLVLIGLQSSFNILIAFIKVKVWHSERKNTCHLHFQLFSFHFMCRVACIRIMSMKY